MNSVIIPEIQGKRIAPKLKRQNRAITIMEDFCPASGVDFQVARDEIDGEKLWKVSYQIQNSTIKNEVLG